MALTPNAALSRLAAAGLCVGALFGLAGTVVSSPTLQGSLWAIDSAALVAATSLLALKYFRAGIHLVAAGFLVFAIGEGVLLSGTAAGPEQSVPAFAAGTALCATALVMISIPPTFTTWIRVVSTAAACLFALTARRVFAGESLLPTTAPLPLFAYPFLVATILGWAWTIIRADSDGS